MVAEHFILSSLQGRLGNFLESIFIFEGRIDLLKKQHEKGIESSHDTLAKHREPHDIIDHLSNEADPSKNKKHTQQILSWYKDKQFRQEDVGRVRQVLKDFEAHGKKLPKVPHPRKQGLHLPGHDISSYNSFHGLNKALEPFRTSQESKFKWGEFSKGDLDHINGKGSTVIHDEPKYTVREVHDQRAMDILGKGANWCVVSNKHRKTKEPGSNDNSSMWDHYLSNHPGSKYFHVHDKETGERFAAHPDSSQHLFDIDDRERGHNYKIANRYREGMSKTLDHLPTPHKLDSPFISQKDLHTLHTDEDDGVRQSVAKHSNTHPDTLHAMSTDDSRHVRSAVADSPIARSDTLHALHTDNSVGVRTVVARNTNTHPNTLHKLHNDVERDVRRDVANNTSTHPDTLHTMHTDGHLLIRRSVASNPKTRPDTLHALHTDEDDGVRQDVAKHPNTHPDILHTMRTDNNEYTRVGVASNPSTHAGTLRSLHTDRGAYVRATVAANPNSHPDILHTLHTDGAHLVRRGVAENPNTRHDTLHALHTDNSHDVRKLVASNKKTHPDTLHALRTDEDDLIRREVAKNPKTRSDTLYALRGVSLNTISIIRKNLENRGLL